MALASALHSALCPGPAGGFGQLLPGVLGVNAGCLVKTLMLRLRQGHEILRSVVGPVSVDVMDALVRLKSSAMRLLPNKPMLVYIARATPGRLQRFGMIRSVDENISIPDLPAAETRAIRPPGWLPVPPDKPDRQTYIPPSGHISVGGNGGYALAIALAQPMGRVVVGRFDSSTRMRFGLLHVSDYSTNPTWSEP